MYLRAALRSGTKLTVAACGADKSQPLIGNKEERFVLPVIQAGNLDWPTECAAEIILPKGGFRRSQSNR